MRHDVISDHYKKDHNSFLCHFCSSVIEPHSKFAEHIERKHNVLSYSKFVSGDSVLYELIGDAESGFFRCTMCNKKKRTNLLFGHYVFYHNFSIHALREYLHKVPDIKINGSSLIGTDFLADEGKEVCNVCEIPIMADSNIHEVFCQGFVMCKQKECEKLFEDGKALSQHIESEHPESTCRFGCRETSLKPNEVDEHLQKLHDIVECGLCNIVNSSGNYRNHLRDKHSVNLMTYEKAVGQTTSTLYRVENSSRCKKQVLCNFCDCDITKQIREFSFVSHYQDNHEIHIKAILRNLDKNPIMDVVLSERKLKTDEDCFKHFTISVENSMDDLVEVDFDTSKVYCIGADQHMEQKPASSLIACEFCKKTSFGASCNLYEHLTDTHGFQLLNVNGKCDTCHVVIERPEMDEDSKSFNLSLVCPLDEKTFVTKDNFRHHMANEHLDQTLMIDKIIYKCFECNFGYNKLDDIRDHFETVHPDIKMSYCRICRFKLTNPGENATHFNLNHADDIKQVEKLRCKLCKKLFTKRSMAKIHYENYHKKKEMNKKVAFKCQFQLCR